MCDVEDNKHSCRLPLIPGQAGTPKVAGKFGALLRHSIKTFLFGVQSANCKLFTMVCPYERERLILEEVEVVRTMKIRSVPIMTCHLCSCGWYYLDTVTWLVLMWFFSSGLFLFSFFFFFFLFLWLLLLVVSDREAHEHVYIYTIYNIIVD